jgi:Protein of unknown function (DUF2500)
MDSGIPIFFILFALVFVGIAAFIVVSIIGSIAEGIRNSASPEEQREASVVSKRMEVRGDHAHTWYYVTFELEHGNRVEFSLSGREYGMLVEGDRGLLFSQGTRFNDFKRSRK